MCIDQSAMSLGAFPARSNHVRKTCWNHAGATTFLFSRRQLTTTMGYPGKNLKLEYSLISHVCSRLQSYLHSVNCRDSV